MRASSESIPTGADTFYNPLDVNFVDLQKCKKCHILSFADFCKNDNKAYSQY